MSLLCLLLGHRWRWVRCTRCGAWRHQPATIAQVQATRQVHVLKCWPQFLEAVDSGVKPFELRRNDRPYRVGDHIILRGWDPMRQAYTGKRTTVLITYVLPGGQFGLADDHCILGIRPLHRTSTSTATA